MTGALNIHYTTTGASGTFTTGRVIVKVDGQTVIDDVAAIGLSDDSNIYGNLPLNGFLTYSGTPGNKTVTVEVQLTPTPGYPLAAPTVGSAIGVTGRLWVTSTN
jgi:hypothetical protein